MVEAPGSDPNFEFKPEVETREPITGHWEDITLSQITRAPEGLYNLGDRMFYFSGVIKDRDKILIEELNGEMSKWEVVGTERSLPYWAKVGVIRNAYHLKRIQAVDTTDTLDPTPPVVEELPPVGNATIPALDPEPIPAPVPPQPEPEPADPEPATDEWVPSWMKE